MAKIHPEILSVLSYCGLFLFGLIVGHFGHHLDFWDWWQEIGEFYCEWI